jgi:hypothetical protein
LLKTNAVKFEALVELSQERSDVGQYISDPRGR